MNLDDLEEGLDGVLPSGFQIEADARGQIVIFTGLRQDDDGELVDFIRSDEDDEDEDFDPDLEPLEEDLDEDD